MDNIFVYSKISELSCITKIKLYRKWILNYVVIDKMLNHKDEIRQAAVDFSRLSPIRGLNLC